MYELSCEEIWGGIKNKDADVCSAGIVATLYSGACDGGKGGDIYYFSVCAGNQLTRVAVADVVGHGENVSNVSAWLYDALDSHMNDLDGNEILAELNSLAIEHGCKAITTAAIAAYHSGESRAYIAYAGHHPILIRRTNELAWSAAVSEDAGDRITNLPLGVDKNVEFTQSSISLRQGDRIFLFTDGLIEAPNGYGELFGQDRLLSILNNLEQVSIMEIKIAVLDAVGAHAGGHFCHDDVSLLVVEVN